MTDVGNVEREIQNNFWYGETIDALFISHLDEDHVNGIPYLLTHCNVKRIYFPFIASENRKFMEIYYHANNIGGFSFDFFMDPYETVRNISSDNAPGDRDKIKQAYARVPGGFNINSMTLFSGETDDTFSRYIRGCCGGRSFLTCKSSGCLYMGDYDASGTMKWKELKRCLSKLLAAYRLCSVNTFNLTTPHENSILKPIKSM